MPNRMLPDGTVAVMSDIHGNYPAFRACYADALAHGAQSFIFLGDYVSDLAQPESVMELLHEIRSRFPTVCLRGNRERYMLDAQEGLTSFRLGSKMGSLRFTYERLREKDLSFFKALPIYDRVEISGIPFEIAHAIKEDDRFYFDTMDGNLSKVFPMMECAFLLTGHSHKQYIRTDAAKTIINPGSVGVPRGHGNWTMYALLDAYGGEVTCHMRQLPYDIEAVIRSQFDSGLVDIARYWAIGILYDVITGKEWTINLLKKVLEHSDEDAVYDEDLWHRLALQMGMKFTEKEILADLERKSYGTDGSRA